MKGDFIPLKHCTDANDFEKKQQTIASQFKIQILYRVGYLESCIKDFKVIEESYKVNSIRMFRRFMRYSLCSLNPFVACRSITDGSRAVTLIQAI